MKTIKKRGQPENIETFRSWMDRGLPFPTVILALLKSSSVSRKDIARYAGCTPQFVSMVLSGARQGSPTANQVQRLISIALGFNPWDHR